MRNIKTVGLEGRGVEEEMGGAKEVKLIIGIYYVRKNNFQCKDKFEEISLTLTLNYRTKRINNTLEQEKPNND